MASVPPTITGPVFYPESDGKPMSDNTRQFRWIKTISDNLDILFADRDDVFTCGNQFWYPVEGRPDIVQSPDVYVVFGRPKGDRPSWKQWEEGDQPMRVVFEILSPGNTAQEMANKLTFYEEYGVEEYYIYDPDTNKLTIYLRKGDVFRRERKVAGFVSPRLGITFDLSGPEMVVRFPDGRPFLPAVQRDQARKDAETRLKRLAALSRKARLGQATAEELAELERLEGEAGA